MRMFCAAAIAALLIAVQPAHASQEPGETAGPPRATRQELEIRLRGLEDLAPSQAAGETQRTRVRAQVAAIRTRLAEGDFGVGERIALVLDAHPLERVGGAAGERPVEQQLTDTFTVGSDTHLTLPLVGVVSLRGVLRSELNGHLTREIARFIREPRVHARPLIRVTVHGGVARPGYYSVPADAVLSDALMAAGGLARNGRIEKLRIERDGRTVFKGDPLQRAIAEGRSLEEMSVRAGDQFIVPERRAAEATLKMIGIALSIPVTLYTLIRLL